MAWMEPKSFLKTLCSLETGERERERERERVSERGRGGTAGDRESEWLTGIKHQLMRMLSVD